MGIKVGGGVGMFSATGIVSMSKSKLTTEAPSQPVLPGPRMISNHVPSVLRPTTTNVSLKVTVPMVGYTTPGPALKLALESATTTSGWGRGVGVGVRVGVAVFVGVGVLVGSGVSVGMGVSVGRGVGVSEGGTVLSALGLLVGVAEALGTRWVGVFVSSLPELHPVTVATTADAAANSIN